MTYKEFSILKSEIYRNATLKECFMDNCDNQCSEKIINAHSLQRMGSLSILESQVNKNKCIYQIGEQRINEKTGLRELIPIGKQKASTFYGFCAKHDESLFKPIEQSPEKVNIFGRKNDRTCFLFSLKAFALSYHSKKEEVHLYSTKDLDLKNKIKIFRNTNALEYLLAGARMGLNDLVPDRKTLIDMLINESYSELDYFLYEVYHTVPFACCMYTSPPFLFSGKAINTSSDPNHKFSDIITSVIPLKKRTIVISASLPNSPHGATYLNELFAMSDIELQKALTWHVLTDMENLFLSPRWFDKLNNEDRAKIILYHNLSADFSSPPLKYPSDFEYNFFDKKHSIYTKNQVR